MDVSFPAKTKHRLTLFYLANDVIQSCRRKKADEFREYFATVLPEAIALLRYFYKDSCLEIKSSPVRNVYIVALRFCGCMMLVCLSSWIFCDAGFHVTV